MILTGHEIQNRLNDEIKIEPFDIRQMNPNSYDLRLHDELLIYHDPDKYVALDFKKDDLTATLKIPQEGLMLNPGTLYLGRTVEWTETYNLVPRIEGKSSIGRKGLSVHVTAGFGDIGFMGYWTLELWCIHPVIIYPGMKICQIQYQTVCGNHGYGYNGKYQNQKKIESSKSYKDFENGNG